MVLRLTLPRIDSGHLLVRIGGLAHGACLLEQRRELEAQRSVGRMSRQRGLERRLRLVAGAHRGLELRLEPGVRGAGFGAGGGGGVVCCGECDAGGEWCGVNSKQWGGVSAGVRGFRPEGARALPGARRGFASKPLVLGLILIPARRADGAI